MTIISIRQKIYKILISVSSIIVFITVALRLYSMCYITLLLNIRKIKNINSKNLSTGNYKVLVLGKSGGQDDLISTQIKYNKKIEYYILPRILIRKIYNFFLEEKLNDYKYLDKSEEIKKRKILYRNFLVNLLKIFKSSFKLKTIISFNLLYKSDREFQFAAAEAGIQFIVLQKECVWSPIEEKIVKYIYKNHSGKFFGGKVAVYSKAEKDRMVNSGLVKKSEIDVVGCSRLDLAFKYKNIKPQNKNFIYYMIENQRGLPTDFLQAYNVNFFHKFIRHERGKIKKLSWSNLNNITLKLLISFAKQNPDVNIILKGKTGIHSKLDLPHDVPNNCNFVDGGIGHDFLKTSSVVICFNSTIVLEAIAANREVLIPFFGLQNDKFKRQFLMKLNLNRFLMNNENQFLNKLNEYKNKKYKIKKLSNDEKKVLNYYLGNTMGNSGKLLNQFLLKNICN